MNDDLKYVFANVNDWLKFAETKNAGLFTLNIISIVGISQVTVDLVPNWSLFRGLLVLVFSLSSALCLFSVLPQIKFGFRKDKKMKKEIFAKKKADLNLLFFRHIASLSPDQYIELFQLKKPNTIINNDDKDLAFQIVNNAEIADRKYVLFSWSCWFTFLGVLFVIGTIVNHLFDK